MNLKTIPDQKSMNSSGEYLLFSSISPSICTLLHFVKQRKGQMTQNSLGQWLIEIPPHSLHQNQKWILQESNSQEWLLLINEVPQFFLSTDAVLRLLKVE